MFRDGGSMGALEIIGTTEVDLMKRAVDSTSGEKVKHFTFLVVTKRIPQRFFYKAVSYTLYLVLGDRLRDLNE